MKKLVFLLSLMCAIQPASAMMIGSKSLKVTDLDLQLIEKIRLGGSVEEISALISNGADVNSKNKLSYRGTVMTPLMMAAEGNCYEVCELLIEKGADVNAQDEKLGNTALLLATLSGRFKIAKLLIEKGADVNAKNKAGLTPLIGNVVEGSSESRCEIGEFLMKNGADVSAKEQQGFTTLELAADNDYDEVCRTILSHAVILPALDNDLEITEYRLSTEALPVLIQKLLQSLIASNTIKQLKSMMDSAQRVAKKDELKKLLNPELLEQEFGERIRANIWNVIHDKKLHLYIQGSAVVQEME